MDQNRLTVKLSSKYMDGLVLYGEMVECWLERCDEFLTKNSTKAWQKLWDLGAQIAIAITSLRRRSMFIVLIGLPKGILTHYWPGG
jgi:hypothetical protein